MSENNSPTKIQIQIGKTSSLDLQEWVKNQSLSINKAVKEALEHFVRIYGTGDITSPETRNAMTSKGSVTTFHTPDSNGNPPQETINSEASSKIKEEDNEPNKAPKIIRGKIDI